MIEFKNVTKKFGEHTAVDGVSFTVGNSSIYGLVGCNGAGKTTLLNTAAGIYKPDSGAALLDGENAFDNGRARERLFYIPDELYFLPGATMDSMAKFYAGYYPDFSQGIYKNAAELFGLNTKKLLFSFSKGMKKQAELALALASRPRFLLLDECFDGVDPKRRSLCRELFLECIAQSECSILMASHNLGELQSLCDHIGFLNGKRLTVDCDIDELSERYVKYRIIFSEEINPIDLDGLDCEDLKLEGRVATFVKKSKWQSVEDYLLCKNIKALDISKSAMTLEEIFALEMGDGDYDIGKIFEK